MSQVSHSEVESYLQCRRKWHYGYARRLQPKTNAEALAYGGVGHKVLEAFYSHILLAGDTHKEQLEVFDEALEIAKAEFSECVSDGWKQPDNRASLWDALFKFYFPNEPFVLQGYLVQAVEYEFVLQYDSEKDLRLPGIIDLIVVSPQKKTVIVDHKFQYDFTSDAEAEMQPQIPKYIGAMRALNHKVHYGMYNMIRTRKIVGTKSKAQPDGAGPTLEQALCQRDVKPTVTRVQTVFLEQIGVAQEITYRRTLDPETEEQTAFRTTGRHCETMCSFRHICEAELAGRNATLVLNSLYEVKPQKPEGIFANISEEYLAEDAD